VNGEGYTIGVQAEVPPRGSVGGLGGAPPPPSHTDMDDDDSDDVSTDAEWKHERRKKNLE
jgi:hypothetical protein